VHAFNERVDHAWQRHRGEPLGPRQRFVLALVLLVLCMFLASAVGLVDLIGSGYRLLAFILKVNSDVERVADHASGIAKVAGKLDLSVPFRWPTALQEMGQRVPAMCHALLRAMLDEDAAGAARVAVEDDTIDALDKRLFVEVEELMKRDPASIHNGLLMYRLSRELERVGDLMKNIAEDVIYLNTGTIVRHEAKRALRQGKA